jgi:hypothetical protein
MAVRLGYDAPLLAALAGRLARAVMQDMRRSVKQQHGLASVAASHAGVFTVVQRFRSDLGRYVHLHCLATDGAYEEQDDGELRFLAAPPPERMTAVPMHALRRDEPRRRMRMAREAQAMARLSCVRFPSRPRPCQIPPTGDSQPRQDVGLGQDQYGLTVQLPGLHCVAVAEDHPVTNAKGEGLHIAILQNVATPHKQDLAAGSMARSTVGSLGRGTFDALDDDLVMPRTSFHEYSSRQILGEASRLGQVPRPARKRCVRGAGSLNLGLERVPCSERSALALGAFTPPA